MKKPRLFIGSSVEGLNIAYAIQENLSYTAEVTVWNQGVFNLSDTTIESLMVVIENTEGIVSRCVGTHAALSVQVTTKCDMRLTVIPQ